MADYPNEFRDAKTIENEMESAKKTAEKLDEDEPMDALATMIVYRTLKWVSGEGSESLDEELLKIDDENNEC